ncbi:MAG: hypothetical protein EPN47_16020 [Acidobacteria bacterium]|nr:MAG: hypothetical protein EPN47_16020 [Acidobacteriota bacterium]
MLSDRYYQDLISRPWSESIDKEDQVPAFLERMRWRRGIKCPRCHSTGITRFKKPKRKPEGRFLYNCRVCHRQFTVTTGTALDRTHVPLEKWLRAIAMMRGSSRNLKPADLVRRLGVTHGTAQLMCRRLRPGMKTSFIRKLHLVMRSARTPEVIFRNIFPHLYE